MRGTLAAALVLLACGGARAEIYASIGGGRATPLAYQGFNTIAAPGYAGGAEAFYHFGYGLGLGLQADYLAFQSRRSASAQFLSKTTVQASVVTGILRWSPFYRKGFGPYGLVGYGVNRFSETSQATPGPFYVWADTGTRETRTAKASSTGAALVLGGGLEALVSASGLTFGAEARWYYLRTDPQKFGGSTARAFTVIGRVGFRFWN